MIRTTVTLALAAVAAHPIPAQAQEYGSQVDRLVEAMTGGNLGVVAAPADVFDDCIVDTQLESAGWHEGACFEGWALGATVDCTQGGVTLTGVAVFQGPELAVLPIDAPGWQVALATLADPVLIAAGSRDLVIEVDGELQGSGATACGDSAGTSDDVDSVWSARTSLAGGAAAQADLRKSVQRYEDGGYDMVATSGMLRATTTDPAGATRDLAPLFADSLVARTVDPYPHTGRVGARTAEGLISLVFSEDTPIDGTATLVLPDGSTQTITLPM